MEQRPRALDSHCSGMFLLLVGVIALGIFLPMFGVSLLVILAVDQLLIRRKPSWKRFFNTA